MANRIAKKQAEEAQHRAIQREITAARAQERKEQMEKEAEDKRADAAIAQARRDKQAA